MPYQNIYLWNISIHTPTKGATELQDAMDQKEPQFQSTLPRRERPIPQILLYSLILFQSTLPRRERPVTGRSKKPYLDISIHTPTKGATDNSVIIYNNYMNFNPHSHEGSDFWWFLIIVIININFNPHSHEGSDTYQKCNRTMHFYFNPHSHEGSDDK